LKLENRHVALCKEVSEMRETSNEQLQHARRFGRAGLDQIKIPSGFQEAFIVSIRINDDDIFERLQLIRNHAEAVVADKGVNNLVNMVGHNFRLGEIESAIGIEQLKKLKSFLSPKN
jgi:hypothetical protein